MLELRLQGKKTLSLLLTTLSLSSIELSPPKSINILKKNCQKLLKIAPSLILKQQRNLERIFYYNKIIVKQTALLNQIISRIVAIRTPIERKYTKRQIKLLNNSRILSIKDTNRSIYNRRKKEAKQEDRRLIRLLRKTYSLLTKLLSKLELEESIE